MTKLVNPIPLFLDGRGALLDGGYIWIGTVNLDPEVPANQLSLFTDKTLVTPIAQPLRTLGGVIVNGLALAEIYFSAADFSITVRDADLNLVFFKPSAFDLGGTSYQPLDSDLTAIAALATTTFGRSFLTLADAAAARTLLALGTAATLNKATAAEYRSAAADKVLIADQVWGAAAYVGLTDAATIALDLATGFNFSVTLGGSRTLANPTNKKEGQSGKILFVQDAIGGRVLTLGSDYKYVGAAPVLSTAANARDILFYEVLPGGTVFVSLAKGVPS